MTTTEDRRRLVNVLVVSANAGTAYHTNATFHATVELLVDIWETLGPTLVEKAKREQAEMDHQVALLRAGQIL
jgi:hypothetical protein